jgi:hypothetical protein
MFTRTATLILGGLLLAGAASAQTHSTERAIETSTLSMRLPRAVPTSISVSSCETCSPVSLNVTQQTQLFFGRKPVTLAELQKLAAGPTFNVSIYYEPSNRSVSRIVVTDRRQQ